MSSTSERGWSISSLSFATPSGFLPLSPCIRRQICMDPLPGMISAPKNDTEVVFIDELVPSYAIDNLVPGWDFRLPFWFFILVNIISYRCIDFLRFGPSPCTHTHAQIMRNLNNLLNLQCINVHLLYRFDLIFPRQIFHEYFN